MQASSLRACIIIDMRELLEKLSVTNSSQLDQLC
jgi:hypothetical protein